MLSLPSRETFAASHRTSRLTCTGYAPSGGVGIERTIGLLERRRADRSPPSIRRHWGASGDAGVVRVERAHRAGVDPGAVARRRRAGSQVQERVAPARAEGLLADVDRGVALQDVGVVDDDVGRPGVVVGAVALEADAEAGVDEHAAVVAGRAVDLHRAVLRGRADEDVAAAHRLDAVLVDGGGLAGAGDVAGDLQVV